MESTQERVQFTQMRINLRTQQRKLLLRRFLSNRMTLLGGIILLVLIAVAVLAPMFSHYTSYEMIVNDRLKPPSAMHWFGTDNFGRDLLTRVAHGGQISLGVGIIVVLLTSIAGMVIGLYSVYYSYLDHILMRVCDALMSFPSILLAISIMAALGPTSFNVIISLSIVFTPHLARVIRSSALVIREQTYIEAIHSQGAKPWRIIWLHIAPNTIPTLITQATFIFAEAIIVEAALSFLGVGVPAPAPSWGNILHDAKTFIFTAWWMTVFPGVFIILSVLGLNLFGDGLRDLLDPHTTKSKK